MAKSTMHSRSRRRLLAGAALIALVFSSFTLESTPAEAANAGDFNPSNIISDSLFYDGNAMNASEVQSFLNARVPRCTIGDPGRTAGMAYGGSIVASSCLKDFATSSFSKPASMYCAAYTGSSRETAAQIIHKVGQACGISQKVLLIMLEKEQSLVTDSWPLIRQLDIAMGYACPDSGPGNTANCDSAYYGFFNQVYRAAWQLQVYKAHPNSYRYKPFQVNTIQWHPNIGCGTSQVYIENWATAALYIYTPYRPNQAALNAQWGVGDGCSAYGNRNFFMFYTSWFGSTQFTSHAHLDTLTGQYNGVRVSGWARKLSDTGAAQVWVNIYDGAGNLVRGEPLIANKELSWFNGYFPGWGNQHGFDATIKVPPGNYSVKVYNSSVESLVFGTGNVYVPVGQGYVDRISQTAEGIRLQGWSVDFRTAAPDTLRVVLDGVTLPQTWTTTLPTDWIDGMFPGMGNNHAYDFTVPAPPGKHTVCVFGAGGLLAPCATVTLPDANLGWIDSIKSVEGGLQLTGWAVNLATPASQAAVEIAVNGQRYEIPANRPLDWFNNYISGAGPNHGFDSVIPHVVSGTFEFCLLGQANGTKIHCITQSVLAGEDAALDSVTSTPGKIRATGWAAIFGRNAPSEIQLNIDGVAGRYLADKPLAWFDQYFPGSGPNHGYDVTIPATPGMHNVCAYRTTTSVLVGCKSVEVPGFVDQGYLDGIETSPNSVRVFGWSRLVGQSDPSDIWVNIDGFGGPYLADKPLAWFDEYFPGSGPNHGFDVRIPVSPGRHEVCVYGERSATLYACRTVEVPS